MEKIESIAKQKRNESKKYLIYFVLFLLLISVIVLISEDSKNIQEELQRHIDNGDVHLDDGTWLSTKINLTSITNTSNEQSIK